MIFSFIAQDENESSSWAFLLPNFSRERAHKTIYVTKIIHFPRDRARKTIYVTEIIHFSQSGT
jgi:hypothetical protein